MKPFITYQLESPYSSVLGFGLTNKFVVAIGTSYAVIHSLQCSHCPRDPGQVCMNSHALFDVGEIWNATIHPTSNLMLTAGRDQRMRLWDLEGGTHIRDFSAGPVKEVLFVDDEENLAFVSGCQNGLIRLWSRTVGEPTRILRGHTDSICRMVSHNRRLFSGACDSTLRIWDITTGACIRILEGHSSYVSVLTFSPDGSLLRAGGGNGEVRIWNWTAGYSQRNSVCQADAIIPSQFSDIEGNLVTCGKDGGIRTWKQEGILIKTFTAHESTPVRAVFKIGRFAVTVGGRDGRLKVWDWQKDEWLFDLQDPVITVWKAVVTDGKLATACRVEDRTYHIRIWELDDIEELAAGFVRGRSEVS